MGSVDSLKAHPQWLTSSSRVPQPSSTAPPSGIQEFKHVCLWGNISRSDYSTPLLRACFLFLFKEPPYFTAEPESRILGEVEESVDIPCRAMGEYGKHQMGICGKRHECLGRPLNLFRGTVSMKAGDTGY